MEQGFWHWFWVYAMDGVVGGLIGGAVTAFAVIATLRYERRRTAEAQARVVVEQMRQVVERIGELATEITSSDDVQTAWEATYEDGGVGGSENGSQIFALEARIEALTKEIWPRFAADVEWSVRQIAVTGAHSPFRIEFNAARAIETYDEWLANPAGYEKRWKKMGHDRRHELWFPEYMEETDRRFSDEQDRAYSIGDDGDEGLMDDSP